jgi:hypothetical protein
MLFVAGLAGSLGAEPADPSPAAALGPSSAPAVPVAQAVDGLSQEVLYSYVVDPVDVVTRVTATATVTHTRPDNASGSWYFDEYALPLPAEATNLWATVDGVSANVSTESPPGFEAMQRAAVGLSPSLRYGQSREVVFGYELGPQSDREDVWSQANEASFMFPAWTFGDPGQASVEVRIPADYEVTVVRGDLERADLDDEVLLSAYNVEDPGEFNPLVLATDESRAVTHTAETSIGSVELVAWPDHDEWIDFVVEHVDQGGPVLSELIGEPWPDVDQNLGIVETLTVVAEGFGGWYDSADHTITIGDRLDPHLVLHELAHVWINFDVFADRWLVEGFAEEYAFLAEDELGRADEPRPTEADLTARPVPLSQWTTPLVRDEASQQTEDFGYSASSYVVSALVEDLGEAAMQDVLGAAIGHEITYVGDPAPERTEEPLGWRQALDLFENHGSTAAGDLFRTYVLTQSQRAELDERGTARVGYAALAEQGDGWTPPLGVRLGMAAWDFEAASAAMEQAEGVLAVREDIDDVLDGSDVGTLGLEEDYESAPDVAALLPVAEETLSAAEAYRDVRERDRPSGPLATIGLWGSSVDGRLDQARQALVDGEPADASRLSLGAGSAMDNATRGGALRVGLTAVVAGALVALVRQRRRRRRWLAGAGTRFGQPSEAVPPSRDPVVTVPSGGPMVAAPSGDALAARRRLQSAQEGGPPDWETQPTPGARHTEVSSHAPGRVSKQRDLN